MFQPSKIKLLYFTGDGKRVSKTNIAEAEYVQFVGRGVDDFFMLPPTKKESFINQLKSYVKVKKEAKNYRTYIYDKNGERVSRKNISKAKYFTLKHKNQELFTDEFPKNIHTKYKEQYLQEVLKQTIKVVTKKEKLIPIEKLPVKSTSKVDDILITRSLNDNANNLDFKTFVSNLFFEKILMENKKDSIDFILDNIDIAVDNCFILIRKEGVTRSESIAKYKWRITIAIGLQDEDTFVTSSEISETLKDAKDQVIHNINNNYNQNKTEGYDYSIKELYLRRIKVVAYEEVKN